MTELSEPKPSRAGPLPDRRWIPALDALLLALVFVAALMVRADGDPSMLVHAAPPWTSADHAPSSLTVQEPDDGFDGQFFYRLGVAPWSDEHRVSGVEMDLPSLRNARWGYGALAFAVSGGDADVVPWALIVINVAAAAALGWIGGALAQTSGRHAAWGLLFFLWPGFAYSLSLDTSELVASTFLMGGLLAARHRRWWAAAAVLTAAVITRDTTAVVPFGFAAAGAWAWWSDRPDDQPDRGSDEGRRNRVTGPLVAGLVPLAAFGVWQLVQRARFGSLPLTSSGDNNLSAPLGGLVEQLTEVLPPGGGTEAFRLLSIVGLVALLVRAAVVWRSSKVEPGERLAWVPAVLVVAVLNAYLWSGATAFMRAGTEAAMLSVLLLLGAGNRPALRLAGLGMGGLWLLTAVAQVSKLG